MVEQGDARFEPDRHTGAIDLGQNVVRQIRHEIEELHAFEQIGEFLVHRLIPENSPGLGYTGHAFIGFPMGDELTVDVVGVLEFQDGSELVQLVAHLSGHDTRWQKRKQARPTLGRNFCDRG